VGVFGLDGQQIHKGAMMRADIEIIEGDVVGRQNPQQGAGNAGVEEHESIAVTRLL
jgi:hypothetical protein